MTPRENILIPFAVTTRLSILFLGHCFQFFVNPLHASLAGGTKLCGNDNKNRENRSFRRWPALQATGVPFAAPSAETTCRSLPPRADDQCRANRRPPTTGGHLCWITKRHWSDALNSCNKQSNNLLCILFTGTSVHDTEHNKSKTVLMQTRNRIGFVDCWGDYDSTLEWPLTAVKSITKMAL